MNFKSNRVIHPVVMKSRPQMAAILFFICFYVGLCSACDVDMAVYKVTMNFLWSEETFPKDYPMHRPKAQWSTVFGLYLFNRKFVFYTNSGCNKLLFNIYYINF